MTTTQCRRAASGTWEQITWHRAWQFARSPMWTGPGAIFDARNTRLVALLATPRVTAPNFARLQAKPTWLIPMAGL
jgi:hypothetical protein